MYIYIYIYVYIHILLYIRPFLELRRGQLLLLTRHTHRHTDTHTHTHTAIPYILNPTDLGPEAHHVHALEVALARRARVALLGEDAAVAQLHLSG